MRKPGQFVSICGKLARVCKHSSSPMNVCNQCMLANGLKIKNHCFLRSGECARKLGYNLYPKLIKQCGNQDK